MTVIPDLTCTKCGKAKPPYLFSPSQVRKKSRWCRNCHNEYQRKRYEMNFVPGNFNKPFNKEPR